MYEKSARFYDAVYAQNDYAGQSARLRAIIAQYERRKSQSLLDVGCGTGAHLAQLSDYFACAGVDLDVAMLAVARQRNPSMPLVQGDMRTFDLSRRFDVVISLFSAIGYMHTLDDLAAALRNFRKHTADDGLVIVEPWLHPENVRPPRLNAQYIEHGDMRIARMTVPQITDTMITFTFHYMIGTPDGVESFTEPHALALYTDDQYRAAFKAAGLQVLDNIEGFVGRGLYIATPE